MLSNWDIVFKIIFILMTSSASAYIGQRITNALTFILQEKGIMGVNYIDDISCASAEDSSK